MLSFFPRGVLDEILNLIESVSEDFPSYSDNKRLPLIRSSPVHSNYKLHTGNIEIVKVYLRDITQHLLNSYLTKLLYYLPCYSMMS